MKFTETHLKGCYILEPTIHGDHRGYFYESYNKEVFEKGIGENVNFVQDNQSSSNYGTLRGLHFQKGDSAQAKLVRVLSGEVLDVAVDIRQHSPTFKQHVAVKLSADNKKQLFVPRGFAHGFVVLSEEAEFFYKCDNLYNKEAEGGIIYNDPELNIDWIVPTLELILSEKDRELSQTKDLND
jgi:dTDP-4-dehydrorhamnose 3,5-epimerase